MVISNPSKHFYEFGSFRIDTARRRLLRDGDPVPLAPKVFDTLLALVEQSGHTVEKDELMEKVWPDTMVEENNLTQNISALRKILGDSRNNGSYILTIPKLGYRFVAEVKEVALEDEGLLVKERTKSRFIFETLTEQGEDEQAANPYSLVAKEGDGAQNIPSTPVAGIFLSRIKGHKGFVVVALVLLVSVSASLIFIWQSSKRNVAAFHISNITRLTSNGNSSYPAISPDGKYIAYVLREVRKHLSIQLMHVETGRAKQIFSPAEYRDIVSLNFSSDGNFIYFAQSETYGNGPVRGLYRISVLGGIPIRLITGLSSYAISPDDRQLAFVRNSRNSDESALMIANADGTGEYRLATRKLSHPFYFLNWSPNGKTIACSVGSTEVSGDRMYPVEVRVADGEERELSSERWQYLSYVLWLADGSGLIVSGSDKQWLTIGAWHISYPGGAVQMLTGIPEIYTMNSQTADSKTMVAQTVKLQTNIWMMPIGEGGAGSAVLARQITTGNDGNHVNYMPDGRLLFTMANGRSQPDIGVMNADGTERNQLTADGGSNTMPSASPDGRYIIFDSDRAGKINIWRMDADGGNPKQLTFGDNEKSPDISPDGKWVVYTSADDSTLWRVPIDGGEAQQLTGKNWRSSLVSPDGKWILSSYREPKAEAQRKIGIIRFTDGELLKMFDIPPDIQWNLHYQWTPDGQAFIYVGFRDGAYNIWKQPINGGKPVQLTDFKSTDEIHSPNFSPDGKQLVFSRGGWMFDILLVRNFH